MRSVYVSSTSTNLQVHRKAVIEHLRQFGLHVVGMEDYPAMDAVPLAQCRQDVRECDLYVGIFAWRYGYVPTEDNPNNLSITENEYEAAIEAGKPRFVFVPDARHAWTMEEVDEGEARERARKLQERVKLEQMVGFFSDARNLAEAVGAAVGRWLADNPEREPPAERNDGLPSGWDADSDETQAGQRRITTDALIAYCSVDHESATRIQALLSARDRSTILSARALLARESHEVEDLEREVTRCHNAFVVLSDAALNLIEREAPEIDLMLAILRARTGSLVGLCVDEAAYQRASDWPFTSLVALFKAETGGTASNVLGDTLEALIVGNRTDRDATYAGLPVVVVAMTHAEAARLESTPEDVVVLDRYSNPGARFTIVHELLRKIRATPFSDQYGETREAWKPFAREPATIVEALERVASFVNREPVEQADPHVKVQLYPLDMLASADALLHGIYRDLSQLGCLVVLDELSLFHDEVWRRFSQSPLFQAAQAAYVTIAPFDHAELMADSERKMSIVLGHQLRDLLNRYGVDCDPQCEFGIEDEPRLRRWLRAGMPKVARGLVNLTPDRQKLTANTARIRQLGHRITGKMSPAIAGFHQGRVAGR